MLWCSSCSLPIQGHQLPKGQGAPSCLTRHCICLASNQSAQYACSLVAVTLRTSISQMTASSTGSKLLGTQPLMTWTQQKTGTSTPGLRITQENQVIKVQLSQLIELVWQLLPQPGQVTPWPADAGNMPAVPPPAEEQVAGTPGANLGLPLPSWLHPRDTVSGVSPGGQQPLLLSPARQSSTSYQGNPLPAVSASLTLSDRQAPITEAQPQHPWPSPVSPGMQGQGLASSLQQMSLAMSIPPVQVPASIRGKIQCGEYIDLSELLAYDFQYRYSGLDDSKALEIVDSKLSLAPKCKAMHLSTLQLWLQAWHLYEDTLLSFYPHRYLELSHYWTHITDLDQCFHWAAVLSYDAQFHHRCAIQGLPCSTFDQQLYIMTLDATAANVSAHRCFWC